MTKKHFEKAAQICRLESDKKRREILIDGFIQFFRGENPRFDEGRFFDACEPVAKRK